MISSFADWVPVHQPQKEEKKELSQLWSHLHQTMPGTDFEEKMFFESLYNHNLMMLVHFYNILADVYCIPLCC